MVTCYVSQGISVNNMSYTFPAGTLCASAVYHGQRLVQYGGYTRQMCQELKETEAYTDVQCCGTDLCNQVDTLTCYLGDGSRVNEWNSTFPVGSLCVSAASVG